jgi:small subunit ribosomal protein S21
MEMGIRIDLVDKEPIGLALRRFKKLLQRNGAVWELRRRAYFIPASQLRRAKWFKKKFKARNATLVAQMAGQQPTASLEKARATFWKQTGKP